MRRDLASLRWLAVACAGALAPPLAVLASGHTLVWRDTAQLYAPLRPAIVEALRSFRLPAWNPWEGGGVPLFAHLLHAVLHPVSVVVAFLTPSTDALIIALVLFAAGGTWLTARVFDASAAAAGVAALTFASSGFVLGSAGNLLYLFSVATGPWAVAGMAAAATRRTGWAAAAAAVSALCLSGDPGAVFAFALMGAVLAWHAGAWSGCARAAGGAALGVALAAVQLVPAWRYVAGTARGEGILDPGDITRWALAPWRLVELVAPGFFVGIPRSYEAPVFAALDSAATDRFPFTPSVFVGGAVLVLATIAATRTRTGRLLAVLAAVFLWLALGHRAGGQQLVSALPVLGALRYWEKMVGPLTLCLALGAALGTDALRNAPSRVATSASLAGAGLSVIGALLLAVSGPEALPGLPQAAAVAAADQLQVGLAHAAIALGLLAAALRIAGRHLAGALVGVVFFQSAAASPFALHFGHPAALAVRPPVLEAAPPGPRLISPLGCDVPEGHGDFDAIDLLSICERRSGRPSTNDEARVDSLVVYSGLTPRRWDAFLASGRAFWPLARRLGNTHVLGRAPRTGAEAAVLRDATEGATRAEALDEGALLVWEVPHRPWASFASAARVAPGLDAARALVAEEVVAGRATVVVEATAQELAVGPGRIIGVRRQPEEVVVEAESATDALLVVNDAPDPGWRAWIDGVEIDLMPADVLARAVRWPSGRHQLIMRYQIPGYTLGCAISLLALAMAAVLLLLQRRK